jgi:hypothetical protein
MKKTISQFVQFFVVIWGSNVISVPSSFADVLSFSWTRNHSYTHIYPFVPVDPQSMHSKMAMITEDENFIKNIFQIANANLHRSRTREQPWTSTYWPLNKGLIADPYTESINPLRAQRELSWQASYQHLENRRENVHAKWRDLSQNNLDKLAPSEKYDLLLGDESFHLTAKLREYAYKWGSQKEHGSISVLHLIGGGALDFANELVNTPNNGFDNLESALAYAINNRGGLADRLADRMVKDGLFSSFQEALNAAIEQASRQRNNFVLETSDVSMAMWEGICHGWATASGNIPRPRRTVTYTLENGKKLKFYPSDIKGLASLMFAHSLIQDIVSEQNAKDIESNPVAGIFMEGLRCNSRNVAVDEWGRFYYIEQNPYKKY